MLAGNTHPTTKNTCPKCGKFMFEDGYSDDTTFWFECPRCFHRVSIQITKKNYIWWS